MSVTTTVNSSSPSNVSSTLVGYSTNIQSTLTSTNGTAGQSSIVFDAVPNVVIGQYVSGTGVVAGSKVIQVAGTIVIISNNLTLDAFHNHQGERPRTFPDGYNFCSRLKRDNYGENNILLLNKL